MSMGYRDPNDEFEVEVRVYRVGASNRSGTGWPEPPNEHEVYRTHRAFSQDEAFDIFDDIKTETDSGIDDFLTDVQAKCDHDFQTEYPNDICRLCGFQLIEEDDDDE